MSALKHDEILLPEVISDQISYCILWSKLYQEVKLMLLQVDRHLSHWLDCVALI